MKDDSRTGWPWREYIIGGAVAALIGGFSIYQIYDNSRNEKVVKKVDGAIGYVKAGSAGKDVKLLRVDGKLPRDPGYRL